MAGRIGRARHRNVTEIVVVVAELQALGGGALARGVKRRRARQDRVAPAHQHVRVVALGDMVAAVHPDAHLGESKARAVLLGARIGARDRARQGGDGGNPERAFEQAAAVETGGDHVADGRVVGRAAPDIVGGLEGLGAGEGSHGALAMFGWAAR